MIKYVIEYGSHATGEQTSLSDRDILIICNRIKKPKRTTREFISHRQQEKQFRCKNFKL